MLLLDLEPSATKVATHGGLIQAQHLSSLCRGVLQGEHEDRHLALDGRQLPQRPVEIDQALGIVKESKEQKNASAFTAFLASPEAREILKRFGYVQP